MDTKLSVQLLLSLLVLGWLVIPPLVDIEKIIVPKWRWTPIRRFEIVPQVVGYSVLVAIPALIWWPGPYAIERLWCVSFLAFTHYSNYLGDLFSARLHTNYDKQYTNASTNDYRPVRTILGHRIGFHAHITAVRIMAALATVAMGATFVLSLP